MAFISAIWTFSNYMTSTTLSIAWLESSYAIGALVIASGLIWTIALTEGRVRISEVTILLPFSLLLFVCSFQAGFISDKGGFSGTGGSITDNPGWGLPIYTVYYFILTFLILWKLYKSQKESSGSDKYKQFRIIFVGALATLIITAITSFILPYFKFFPLGIIDNVGFLIFLGLIAYSITKHHLFNIKVIAVELITFSLWTIMLIRTLIAPSFQNILIEGGLFTITVILGILLIRSTIHEIHQRENIETLAGNLQKAYASVKDLNDHLEEKVLEQTKEIKAAYDVEKHAHDELVKLNDAKDQFIMITQHHLRTPITSLKWQIESTISGTYGFVSKTVKKALEETKGSTERLTHIINDFLNISAMRAGEDILSKSPTSLLPLLKDTVQELDIMITKQNIKIIYPHEESNWPNLNIDVDKIKEVLVIVLENAIRYNKENGLVEIKTRLDKNNFILTIENPGIGISPEDKDKLFKEFFYRGNEAKKINTTGMGVGLSVAKAVIEAHGGNIWIDSDLEKSLTSVKISLPA